MRVARDWDDGARNTIFKVRPALASKACKGIHTSGYRIIHLTSCVGKFA